MTVRTQYLDSKVQDTSGHDELSFEVPKSKLDLLAMGKEIFAVVAALKATDIAQIIEKMKVISGKKLIVAIALAATVFMGRD